MPNLSFDEIKAKFSVIETVEKLGLVMKKQGNNSYRSVCPACPESGPRDLVVTPHTEKYPLGTWYCFRARKGGSVLALVEHVNRVHVKEAAAFFGKKPEDRSSTAPESEAAQGGNRTNSANSFKPLDYLQPDHDTVEMLGFSAEFAKSFGIGFSPRGVMSGSVAIPLRDHNGTLLGYVAVQELTYIAPAFTPNVVAFTKKTA